jgi:hypothetical protein
MRGAARERLPTRRACEGFEIEALGLQYHVSVGHFADGRLAEIFLNAAKPGSAADSAAADSAITASIALQYGVPLGVLRHALLRDSRGQPSGPLGLVLDKLAEEAT